MGLPVMIYTGKHAPMNTTLLYGAGADKCVVLNKDGVPRLRDTSYTIPRTKEGKEGVKYLQILRKYLVGSNLSKDAAKSMLSPPAYRGPTDEKWIAETVQEWETLFDKVHTLVADTRPQILAYMQGNPVPPHALEQWEEALDGTSTPVKRWEPFWTQCRNNPR